MSTLGKIFLGIALVTVFASIVLGVLINNRKTQYLQQLEQSESAIKSAPAPIGPQYTFNFRTDTDQPANTIRKANEALKSTQSERDKAKTEAVAKTSELTVAQAAKSKLDTELAAVSKELSSMKGEYTENKAKVTSLENKLRDLNTSLKGETPENLYARIGKAEAELKTIQDEKRKLDDQYAEASKLVKKFEEEDKHRKDKTAPSDLSGKVAAINKAWSFVVLDVGRDNKLVEGVELIVYRGDKFVGKIRTVSVDANTAIADILPDWTQSEIQVGDQVFF